MFCGYDDLIRLIFHNFLDWNDKRSLLLTRKKDYHNFIEFYRKSVDASNKIKKYYLKYGLFNDELCSNSSKRRVVHYYIINYPINYLLEYPNFMADKLNREDLREWITNNLDNDAFNRSKNNIKEFLSLNTISVNDIFYTGW